MLTSEAPLVPPARLAALLIARRVERGLDLAEMAKRSKGEFAPSYLEGVERGMVPLDEDVLGRIVELYEVEAQPVVPSRSKLLLDLDRQELQVGGESISFESPTTDAVLQRYVSLLYLLRGARPGRRLTLRDADLDVLGSSLGRDEQRLRDELFAIMASSETVDATDRLRRRKAILGAGLLVGATAIGSLVLVTQTLPDTAASQLFAPAEVKDTGSAASGGPISDSPLLISVTTPASASAFNSEAELIGMRAEAMIDFDFRSILPGWKIEYAGDSDQWHGLTNSVTSTITIHVEPDAEPQQTAEVLMHEVGHAIDLEYMTDESRREWIELRGMPSTWWTGEGLNDFAVGAGDFAEAVAALTTGSRSQSVYGEFTFEQLSFVQDVLRR